MVANAGVAPGWWWQPQSMAFGRPGLRPGCSAWWPAAGQWRDLSLLCGALTVPLTPDVTERQVKMPVNACEWAGRGDWDSGLRVSGMLGRLSRVSFQMALGLDVGEWLCRGGC